MDMRMLSRCSNSGKPLNPKTRTSETCSIRWSDHYSKQRTNQEHRLVCMMKSWSILFSVCLSLRYNRRWARVTLGKHSPSWWGDEMPTSANDGWSEMFVEQRVYKKEIANTTHTSTKLHAKQIMTESETEGGVSSAISVSLSRSSTLHDTVMTTSTHSFQNCVCWLKPSIHTTYKATHRPKEHVVRMLRHDSLP